MNIQPALLFCFLSALQDGNIGLINAEIPSFTRTEGQNITVPCPYTERRTYICKDECAENIIEMHDVRTQSGRYIMEYKTSSGSDLYVTITQLTKSDSGRYRCGLDIRGQINQYKEFNIIVTDVQSASAITTTQSFRKSTTSPSTETTNQSEEQHTIGVSGYVVTVYIHVILTVVVLLFVVLLLAAILLLLVYRCMKRKSSDNVNNSAPLTSINMEPVVSEISVPSSTLQEYENVNASSTYETLDPATMDDQTYSTLNEQI